MNQTIILKEITKLENPYPPDNLINEYRDFLQHRDCIPYLQFNPNVFSSIVNLAFSLWLSEKKISRVSLLTSIKRYKETLNIRDKNTTYYSDFKQTNFLNLDSKIAIGLFDLVKLVLENLDVISNQQQDEIMKLCNSLLIGIAINNSAVEWYLANYIKIPFLKNRIFYYPIKSNTFSEWASLQMDSFDFVEYRANLIGLILNKNQNYEIDLKLIANDFEHLNKIDSDRINKYLFHIDANEIIEKEFGLKKGIRIDQSNGELVKNVISQEYYPELKLSNRKYKSLMSLYDDPTNSYSLIDFEMSRENFYNNIEITRDITMLWGIYYSKLDIDIQFSTAKKYCTIHTIKTAFKVFSRTKNIKGLKYLFEITEEN